MGRPSVPSNLLRQIWPRCNLDRLPSQRGSYPTRNDFILAFPIGTQCVACITSPGALSTTASCDGAKETLEATDRKPEGLGSWGERETRLASSAAFYNGLQRRHAGNHLSCNPRRRF